MTYWCKACGVRWYPYMTHAGTCPSCGGGTQRVNAPATPSAMALHRALRAKGKSADAHERFEEFYAAREAGRTDALEILAELPTIDPEGS